MKSLEKLISLAEVSLRHAQWAVSEAEESRDAAKQLLQELKRVQKKLQRKKSPVK